MNPNEVFFLEMPPPLHHHLHHQDNPRGQPDFPADSRKEKRKSHVEKDTQEHAILVPNPHQPAQDTHACCRRFLGDAFFITRPICLENVSEP